jgi:hypothetical protein
VQYTHRVESWQDPLVPVTGPKFDWGRIGKVTVHYTAAENLPDGDPGEDWGRIPQLLRNIQRSYVDGRGYSIGYNAAVDQRGHTYELRGDRFRCAANGITEPPPLIPAGVYLEQVNSESFAVLCLVDGNDRASEAMAEAVRGLVAQVEAKAGRKVQVGGHFQTRRTSCPGDGLKRDLAEGRFVPRVSPPVDPVVPVEEDEVKLSEVAIMWNHSDYGNVFLISPYGVVQVHPTLFPMYRKQGVRHVTDRHMPTLKMCLAQSGMTQAELSRP